MSRTLLATICLSTAMMGGENAAAAEAGGYAPPGLEPQFRTDLSGLDGGAEGRDWLSDLTTADTMALGPDAIRHGGGRILFHSGDDSGDTPYGAAAALEIGIAEPGYARVPSRLFGQADTAVAASLITAVGVQSDAVSAGAFSELTYVRLTTGDHGTAARPSAGAEALTGSIGLQSTARLDTPMGVLEPQFRLSLDHDFDIGDAMGDPLSQLGRRNIYVEERDATEFDLDNAISLRMKGVVPGWFHYETRIRVRREGLREISGRIRFKW